MASPIIVRPRTYQSSLVTCIIYMCTHIFLAISCTISILTFRIHRVVWILWQGWERETRLRWVQESHVRHGIQPDRRGTERRMDVYRRRRYDLLTYTVNSRYLNSDISISAKLKPSFWIKNAFWLLSPAIVWRWGLFYKSKLPALRVLFTHTTSRYREITVLHNEELGV